MNINGLTFTVLNHVPTPEYPLNIAAFARNIDAHVSGTDTVRIRQFVCNGHDCPSIIGSITHVVSNPPGVERSVVEHVTIFVREDGEQNILRADEALHPYVISSGKHELLLRMNWYAEKNDNHINASDFWIPLTANQRRSTIHLPEAGRTNCVVWVSPDQITDTIFVPHIVDIINQKFGQSAGRVNTFFVRFDVLFPADFIDPAEGGEALFNLVPIELSDYHLYGTSSSSTITERRLQALSDVTCLHERLLTRMGRMGGRVTDKVKMSRESWEFILRCLIQQDHGDYLEHETEHPPVKQTISHPNLSLETARVITTQKSARTSSREGVDVFRSVFCRNIGVGVKKKHPPVALIGTRFNPRELEPMDTIDMIHIDLPEADAVQHRDWFDGDFLNNRSSWRRGNFITLSYDSRLCECCMAIKCTAMIANCNVPRVHTFLAENEITWPEETAGEVRTGLILFVDRQVWRVMQINRQANEVIIELDQAFGSTQGTINLQF